MSSKPTKKPAPPTPPAPPAPLPTVAEDVRSEAKPCTICGTLVIPGDTCPVDGAVAQ